MSEPTLQKSAKRVGIDQIQACGERLRQGELVSFPTETVYGLGCHALDESACRKVFEAKERPLTDPLIAHVLAPHDALDLFWNAKDNSPERRVLECLTSLWPGPLTIVARAKPEVPSILMAGTNFVACRSPSHPVAQLLLKEAKIPIAAPSANKFGHVSPTTADHVWDDLQNENVWILENNSVASNVGVESTVAKLTMHNEEDGEVTLLRQGAVSVQDLQTLLDTQLTPGAVTVRANSRRATGDDVANVAPGQTIRHYSPNIPSYLLSDAACQMEGSEKLASTVILDFGRKLVNWKDHCLEYRDLSETGDSGVAARAIFDTLRWAEQVHDAERILFPFIQDEGADALTLAVQDRLTRAASGVVLDKI